MSFLMKVVLKNHRHQAGLLCTLGSIPSVGCPLLIENVLLKLCTMLIVVRLPALKPGLSISECYNVQLNLRKI